MRPTTSRVHGLADLGLEVHEVGSDQSAADALRRIEPEVVFHLATLFPNAATVRDPVALIDANVRFGAVLAAAASEVGSVFVTTSSSWQHYGGNDYSPVSLYAATKQAFNDILRYFGELESLPVVDVCLYDTYGPDDDRTKLVSLLFEGAHSGRPIPMSDGYQLINLTHVSDVVAGIVSAMDAPPGSYVLRSQDSIQVRSVVDLVRTVTGEPIPIQWGSFASRPREMVTDWTFGTGLPGWQPEIDLASGLRELWLTEGDRDRHE
jgi:nucleoside-diphosphate-sugar epimerase